MNTPKITITHDNLPLAVQYLTGQVDHLIELLMEKDVAKGDIFFNLEQLCAYRPDKPSKSTVYAEVSRGDIPHIKKSKKLIFLKSSIDAWIIESQKKTKKQMKENAHSSLK